MVHATVLVTMHGYSFQPEVMNVVCVLASSSTMSEAFPLEAEQPKMQEDEKKIQACSCHLWPLIE